MGWTATTTPREANRKDGKVVALPMVTAETIYKGDIVRSIAASGLVTSSGAPATGDVFVGIASETVKVATALQLIKIEQEGSYDFTCASFATANIGDIAYLDVATNQQTVASSSGTHAVAIGTIVSVNLVTSATSCRVKILAPSAAAS
jgi:hypothetical protein